MHQVAEADGVVASGVVVEGGRETLDAADQVDPAGLSTRGTVASLAGYAPAPMMVAGGHP